MTDEVVTALEAAAVPAEVDLLTAAQTAFASIFNGAPETAGIRAVLASQKFLADLGLDGFTLGTSEFQAIGALVQTGLAAAIVKAKAKAAPAA